jgi:integrase
MAKIKFLLQSKSENAQIYIRVSISQKASLKKKTGFTINPKDWSDATGLPKQNNPENKKLSNNLKKLDPFVLENLNNDLASNVLIDSFWLETQINKCFNRVDKTDAGLLINHIQYIIDNANTRHVKTNGGVKIGLSKGTIKNYVVFKNIILEYQKTIKKQIQFIEITSTFVDKLTNWLINIKKYSSNTAGRELQILKTICIDAEKNEITVTPYSKKIQYFRESDKDRYIQTLSFEELEQIKNTDFNDLEHLKQFKKTNPELTKNLSLTTEELNNARNWILIGCEIGQRVGDLLNIKNEDIRKTAKGIYIDILQEKTNKSVTAGVIAPHVINIIENNLPKKISHQKLNNYAKVICKLAGIVEIVKGTKLNIKTNRKELGKYPKYELITTHCFRRSFASNYYKKIPTPVLIGITGHSKESLFLTYINKREDKDSNADLFMKFYEDIFKDKKPEMKIIKNGTDK